MVMMPPVVILTLVSFRFLARTAEAVPGVTLNTPESLTDMRVPAAWLLTLLVFLVLNLAGLALQGYMSKQSEVRP
jgi:cytochrome b561